MIGTQCICYLYANVHSALPRPGRLLVHSHKSAVWQVNHHTQREKRGERRKVNWMESWKKGKWRKKTHEMSPLSSWQLILALHNCWPHYFILYTYWVGKHRVSHAAVIKWQTCIHKRTQTRTNRIRQKTTTAHTCKESSLKMIFDCSLLRTGSEF